MSFQSQSSSLCNLMLQESDLKKLQELDPYQTDGFKTLAKVQLPVRIVYCDELANEISDTQILTVQVLTRWLKSNSFKDKDPLSLDQIRLCIISESDLYLNFMSNCTSTTFETLKGKNSLNLHFADFPNTLVGMMRNCRNPSEKSKKMGMAVNYAELRISYQGTSRFLINQQTEYKNLELLELFFSSCNVEKVQQSIIYRFNFQNTKLAMLQNSIQSIYNILGSKNHPLLQYIQTNV